MQCICAWSKLHGCKPNYRCILESNVSLLYVSVHMCLFAVVIRVFDNPWRTAGRTLCAGHVTGSHKIAVTCALLA